MHFYRTTWPEVLASSKFYMLENQAIPFFQKWGAGCGFYGEQGGVSIYLEFNNLNRVYQSFPCSIKHLKSFPKCHHQKTNPKSRVLIPETRNRKKAKMKTVIFKNIFAENTS